jgi:acetoin utilization protein AcuB
MCGRNLAKQAGNVGAPESRNRVACGTSKDLEKIALAEKRTVREAMSSEVTTLEVNDKLSIADDVMRLGRIRHMPVLDEDGSIVGIVSQRDLFRGALARSLGYGEHAQQKLLGLLFVKDVMTTNPSTIGPDEPLSEAARRLHKEKIGCLLVTEDDKLVGILTESDFVQLFV